MTIEQTLRDALNRAWLLGQTYWAQADSDSYAENRRADQTRNKFQALVKDTLAQMTAPTAAAVPDVGDYVLATKYTDGDPGDAWALGFYDGVRGGRHYVKDSQGRQIRGNGYRRVAAIRPDVGRWLMEVAAPHLERCPPGTVNLWAMLTPSAFDLAAAPAAQAAKPEPAQRLTDEQVNALRFEYGWAKETIRAIELLVRAQIKEQP
jgi:hypothetical protein